MDVEDESRRLWQLVDQTWDLLTQYGINYWAEWLRNRAERLRSEGAIGAGRFAEGWGGMGGFQDLIIHPLNGHPIAEEDVDNVNSQSVALQAETFRTANRIKTNALRMH